MAVSSEELEEQTFFMKNEYCFKVDEEDRILGTLSKYESHTINPNTGLAPLHRAFSVFLIRPGVSGFELLLQQRSKHKFTFPLMWANSCCSHPIDGIGEDTPDVLTGVALAAIRKLKHELGIPPEITRKGTFYHYNRIQYHAAHDHILGEHEIDHILLMQADNELVSSISINPNEVKEIKFVPIHELNSIKNPTPWLHKIIDSQLLSKWIDDFSSEFPLTKRNQLIVKTRYSDDPIIKLMAIEEPLDLIRLSIDENVFIKMKGERELRGKLHAFDQHMNLVLGDVVEVKTIIPEGEEDTFVDGIGTPERITRQMKMLFVRGDSIILVSPIN